MKLDPLLLVGAQAFMLFAGRRAGIDDAIGLAEQPERIVFVDGDKNTLVEDRFAIGIEQHKVGGPKGFAGQHDRLRIRNGRIGDFRIADDDLGDRAVEL